MAAYDVFILQRSDAQCDLAGSRGAGTVAASTDKP